MTGQLGLELGPLPEAPPQVDVGLSADRRRTARQHAAVEQGVHPLTGGRARPDLGTCGGCLHRRLVGHHSRAYPKCDQGADPARPLAAWPYATKGAASDVRAWWPACGAFEPRHEERPDA